MRETLRKLVRRSERLFATDRDTKQFTRVRKLLNRKQTHMPKGGNGTAHSVSEKMGFSMLTSDERLNTENHFRIAS